MHEREQVLIQDRKDKDFFDSSLIGEIYNSKYSNKKTVFCSLN